MANDREQKTLEPPHPGDFIRDDILPALHMTIKDLAKHLGVNAAAGSPSLVDAWVRATDVRIHSLPGRAVRATWSLLTQRCPL